MRISQRGCIVLLLILAAECLIVAGCNAASPTSPQFAYTPGPTPTVYSGTIIDSVGGTATLKVSLVSAANVITGTLSFGGNAGGWSILGTLSGNNYTAIITPCSNNSDGQCETSCSFSFAGSLTSSSLSGTYTGSSNSTCVGQTGSINTTK
jgi:hypothetical protein